jgi:hypothetical protein
VKRRYVWKLPGVDGDRKMARDVRAQSRRNHGRSSRPEMAEGLEVGGKSCRSRHGCCWGVLRDALLVFMPDWCCLTAHHRTDLEKLVLRQAASEPLGVVPIKQTCRTRRWHHEMVRL